MRNFIWKNIICRYGIPKVLVSDNRKQFDNDEFRDFCSQLGIKNQSLLKIIKTQLEGVKGIWPDELASVLWAYRTTTRMPTGETPFRLAYGSEAVIPVEVGLTSYKVGNHDKGKNDEAMHLQLDLVDEVRTTAELRLARYQNLMAKHNNSKVRHRDFQVGDLVLTKVTAATKGTSQGKLGPN